MKTVEQIATIVNTALEQATGKANVLSLDLSNIVDVGKEVLTSTEDCDNVYKALADQIGRVIFVDRAYTVNSLGVLRDGWEYGSILEKIHFLPTEFEDSTMWDLVDGKDYSPHVYKQMKIAVKFFNEKKTYMIKLTYVQDQLKSAFKSRDQLMGFISGLETMIRNQIEIALDSLVRMTVLNFIGTIVHAEFNDASLETKTTAKAVNLLKWYNDMAGTQLTKENCKNDKDFLRMSSMKISQDAKYLKDASEIYNLGGTQKFTPKDRLHVVLLSDFVERTKYIMQSDTYHKELVELPNFEEINFWQGTGQEGTYEDRAKVHINIKNNEGTPQEVTIDQLVGVMFDHEALGVLNPEILTDSEYTKPARFWNTWYTMNSNYFNDFNENGIVYFIA